MKRGVWGSKPLPCNEHPVQFGQAYVWSHPLLSLFTCYVTAGRLKIIFFWAQCPPSKQQRVGGCWPVSFMPLMRAKKKCVCVWEEPRQRSVKWCRVTPRGIAQLQKTGAKIAECERQTTQKNQARRSSWHAGFACARTGTHARTR